MNSISREDYQYVTGFLYREAGISLGGDKVYLVENRLSELCRSLGCNTISALVQKLKFQPCAEIKRKMVEAMTTNETSFFRDITPFDSMRSSVVPEMLELRKSIRQFRIWSAACSTGQEPYSLAMLLESHFGKTLKDWRIEILGTDIAEKVLARARQGEFSQLEINRGVPPNHLHTCFVKHGNHFRISDPIRKLVSFQKVNLLEVPPQLGAFDIIFCRNVLIYFDLETKRKVLANLHRHLRADGYLVVGASEVLFGVTDLFERAQRGSAIFYRPLSS